VIRGVPKETQTQKELNSFYHSCGLGHLKASRLICVFEGLQPNLQALMQTVTVESTIWRWAAAGASKLKTLLTGSHAS
jgi:hypothetical protein